MKIIRNAEAFIEELRAQMATQFGPKGTAVLDASLLIAQKTGLLEDAALDTVQDIDAIVEGMKDAPEWVKALILAFQADADKALAAIGHYGELAQKLSALVVMMRDGKHLHVKGLDFGGDTTIGGEAWIE